MMQTDGGKRDEHVQQHVDMQPILSTFQEGVIENRSVFGKKQCAKESVFENREELLPNSELKIHSVSICGALIKVVCHHPQLLCELEKRGVWEELD